MRPHANENCRRLKRRSVHCFGNSKRGRLTHQTLSLLLSTSLNSSVLFGAGSPRSPASLDPHGVTEVLGEGQIDIETGDGVPEPL